MEGEEILGDFEEGETVIRIYCVKKSVSNKIQYVSMNLQLSSFSVVMSQFPFLIFYFRSSFSFFNAHHLKVMSFHGVPGFSHVLLKILFLTFAKVILCLNFVFQPWFCFISDFSVGEDFHWGFLFVCFVSYRVFCLSVSHNFSNWIFGKSISLLNYIFISCVDFFIFCISLLLFSWSILTFSWVLWVCLLSIFWILSLVVLLGRFHWGPSWWG